MRPAHTVLRIASVLVTATLACSLTGAGDNSPSPGDAALIPGETQPAGSTEVSQPTPSMPLEPPSPGGLTDALQAKVDSGEWTYEEGLVRSLQLFAGEAQVSEVYAQPPASLEGFGLIRETQRYLRVGGDAATKAEIERLLRIIAPPPERLLEYSSPAPTSSARPEGLAAPVNLAEDCETLYKDGFPPGSGIKCLLLKEGGVSGQTVRIFWPMIGVNLDYADAAYNGVIIAWKKFSELTPPAGVSILKGVDVVFSLLNAVENPQILAMVPSASTDPRCLIVVYLPAIQENEQNKGGPNDMGPFMQTLAHEMFHCYQVWNFPEQADDKWSVQDWWGEGTATYFSNVVWPELNDEWSWLGAFAYHSADTPLIYMDYDNFVFFQFLGKSIGDNGVLKVIASMPFGGDEQGQAAALAGFPGMQQLFHDFGRAYMDGTILDTSGKALPTVPPYFPPGHKIDITMTQIRTLDVEPFILGRYAIRFPHGRQYTISQQLTGSAEGYLAARTDMAVGAWADLPPKVAAGCGAVIYYVVLTNASSTGTFATEVTMTPDKEVGCDPCLVGTWDLNIPSFQEYSEDPFAEIPDFYTFGGADGLWRYRFRSDGTMTGEFGFSYGYQLHQPGNGLGPDVETTGQIDIQGTGLATYASDGLSNMNISLVKDNVSVTDVIYVNGEKLDASIFGSLASGLGFPNGDSIVYSCDVEAGILLINAAPQANLPPIQYDRVSTDPNKP